MATSCETGGPDHQDCLLEQALTRAALQCNFDFVILRVGSVLICETQREGLTGKRAQAAKHSEALLPTP